MSDEKKPSVVYPVLGTPKGMVAVRDHGDHRELVGLTRAEEGKPILGEAVSLRRREDGAFDCQVLHAGPAKVTSAAYRSGWDATFGRSAQKGQMN